MSTQLSLFKLGVMFQDNQYLTIQMITEQLNVSARTAYRYIDLLKREYDAPISNDHMNKVYHLTKSWDILKELNKKLRSQSA